MAVRMLEKPLGDICYIDGHAVRFDSAEGRALLEPTDDMIYYESIRFKSQIMIFFEAHMLRLHESVAGKENFAFDSEQLYEQATKLMREVEPEVTEGNLRIVLTNSKTLVHLSDASYPPSSFYQEGIVSSVLEWERIEPQIKVFRGDYKAAVAAAFKQETPFGMPYEVLLCDHAQKITEGSRSNFFVLFDQTVYSPSEDCILIGITRKYVLKAMLHAGLHYQEKTFALSDLVELQGRARREGKDFAVFVTSSPFDILPIKSISEFEFYSASSSKLQSVAQYYKEIVDFYIQSRQSDHTTRQ